MQKTILLTAVLLLSGCGVATRMKAHSEMTDSKERYKSCLIENSSNPQACEGLRLAYEADTRDYTAVTGQAGTVNINQSVSDKPYN